MRSVVKKKVRPRSTTTSASSFGLIIDITNPCVTIISQQGRILHFHLKLRDFSISRRKFLRLPSTVQGHLFNRQRYCLIRSIQQRQLATAINNRKPAISNSAIVANAIDLLSSPGLCFPSLLCPFSTLRFVLFPLFFHSFSSLCSF